jgi:hypothetical protein
MTASGVEPKRGFRVRWWLLLAVGYLVFSGVYSQRAPCGDWLNKIFGQTAWTENDPGTYYVASAHQLRLGEAPLFIGHPGATLTPLLLGVQSLLYLLEAPEGTSFTSFTAQNLPQVFLVSKLLMTVLHLVSFAALYALSKELLRDTRAASFAVLGYATSFPVLYFLSRISVEPLMVTFFAIAFLGVWRYQDRVAEGRIGAAFGYAALASAAAVSGAMTKLAFLGPLPFFLLLYIAAGVGQASGRTRMCALGIFAAVGLALLLAFSQIIDWREFSQVWIAAAQSPTRSRTLLNFLPGFGPGQILPLAELGFVVLSLIGWVRFLLASRDSGDRSRALWLSIYGGCGLLVFSYRVALEGNFLPFHYFFLGQAVLSVFFGFSTTILLRQLGLAPTGWRSTIAGLGGLVILHGVGAWAVVDSRRYDATVFESNRAAFELVSQLGPTDRIALEIPPEASRLAKGSLARLHGIYFPNFVSPRRSVLGEEFDAWFVPVASGSLPADVPRITAPSLGGNLAVRRGAGAPPR